MSTPSRFRRTRLAEQFADQILADGMEPGSGSGLFLAAPRRTGKSTFMREDLRPQLEARGALVLYVDLWADRKADPGDAIITAVRAELAKHEGLIAQLARAAGMEKVSIGGVAAFSLDRIGLGSTVSLSAALAALSDEIKRPMVLIIDEAQHAITTERGDDALFALKAARDEVNSSSHYGLRIVATGSNQDKLAMLRNSKDQAFFGAPLVAFPTLGDDYIAWFCESISLPGKLDRDSVGALFRRAASRPEILGAAMQALRFDFAQEARDVPARFAAAVEAQIQADDDQTLRVFHGLTPLQSAVLRVLAAKRGEYAPFEAATIAAYRRVLKTIAPDEMVTPNVANVQQALAALQEKSLIWKERRGVYALEESALADLLASKGLLDIAP